jgi:transposase InsO family protein
MMKTYLGDHSKSLMSRAMGVSRSGFNKWLTRSESIRSRRRGDCIQRVKQTFEEFEAIYGAPRITQELNAQGVACSENYIAKIMSEQGIRARNGKGFKYSRHSLTMNNVSENLLWRDFYADKPNQKWTSDITYIWVKNRWFYLATVMDLFSRRIIGWSFDESMTVELIEEALAMAVARRDAKAGLIVHSDRGVQYRSQQYIDCLNKNGYRISMSRKGNCWDNAPMESFYSRLKVELIYAKNYQSIDEARSGIFNYIEIFYNRKRRHSANDGVSPAAFEEKAALAA